MVAGQACKSYALLTSRGGRLITMITRNTKWFPPRRNAIIPSRRHPKRGDMILEVWQIIYNYFREHSGDWPSLSYIDRHLDRYENLDITEVIYCVPAAYMRKARDVGDGPDSEEKLILSAAAIACCNGSADDIANFISALQYLGERETGDLPIPQLKHGMSITEEELASALGLPLASDAKSIKRLIALLEAERVVSSNEYG